MNWTVDNNDAYDYAADTRGYTFGVMAEYHVPAWTLRGGVMVMPLVANGIRLDHDLRHARDTRRAPRAVRTFPKEKSDQPKRW